MSTRDLVQQLQRRPDAVATAFVGRVYDLLVERFSRNDILTYASAIAVQLQTALIPPALLSFLLICAFHDQTVSRDQLAPTVAGRTSVDPYQAIDSVAEGLISGQHIALLIRVAPNAHEPPGWVTLGSVIVVVAWIGASLVFGWWVTSPADYTTPFGTVIAL